MTSPAPACEFCAIVAKRAPAMLRYEDDDLVVFHNRLTWVPVMLLVAPKQHMDQRAFWSSPLFAHAARIAVDIAQADCPGGYRLVSNFGHDGMQTQPHAHLHIVGGIRLGLYVDFAGKDDWWLRMYGGRLPR